MAEQDLSGVRSLALDAAMPDRLRAFMQERATLQIEALHTRLDALLAQQQQRFLELETRFAGMNPTVLDQVEAFYGALDDMRDDRLECAESFGLAQLHDRLDEIQQGRQQEQQRSQEQGMGY